jgi:hypothetical protein
MKKTKLFRILSSFTPVEMNRLKKFTYSPYFNKNESIQQIISYLDNVLREGFHKDNELPKQIVWSKIKNKQKFDDGQFRKICSDSIKLVEKWLIQEEFENEPFYQANFLLDSVYEKKITHLKNSAMKSSNLLFHRSLQKNSKYYFQRFRQERSYYNLFDYEKNRYADSNLNKVDLNLDVFYYSEKLKNACEILVHQQFSEQEFDPKDTDIICNKIDQLGYTKYAPINAFYLFYKMNREFENESHFFKFISWIEDNVQLFSLIEANKLFTYAVTYCINKLNLGKFEFIQHCFEIYKKGLNNDIFIINNQISTWEFKNIASISLRLREFDWTNKFISEYSIYLEDDEKDNIITYLKALISFYQHSFNDVVFLLQNVEYSDLTYSLNSKAMLVGAYYELDEVDVLSSFISSFRTFLNRKLILSESRKRAFINFLNFTRKLMSSRVADKTKILKLQKQIQEEKNVASKQWLLDKASELV